MKSAIFKTLRPKQWAKNLICFIPLLFSGRFGDHDSIVSTLICFLGLCAISSFIYILNDFVDVASDKEHPVKKFRPIASGQITAFQGQLLAASCLILGLSLGFYERPFLALIFVAYLVLNLGYICTLKNFAIIDILCISAGFVLRAVAGAAAIHVQPSEWFLLCTTLGAMFLALEKRRQELNLLAESSSKHRSSLSQYTPLLLQRMENVILPSLVTSYAFYSFLSFHGKFLMLTVPIVLFGIMRYQYLSESNKHTGTPEDVFWYDRPTQVALVAWVVTSLVVIYGSPASWLHDAAQTADHFHVQKLPM
ncbi:MAG: decaprenyl-phosphate phosphoribosyltransferase [Candidatus Obscuribacterales bacterium]|nr:decaprenyl-phosphate phosphoribosyltransferase [Candidatus Obscuribacterales bacterium]